MLYESARVQHIEDIVKPNLAKGCVVICDRFTDSTIAYQGYGRKIDIKTIEKLNNIATLGINPDLTIYLDIDPKIGIVRAKAKKCFNNGDRIERENIKFHNDVRRGFLALAKKYPKRIKTIKTEPTVKDTRILINAEIEKFLSKRKKNV
jgi:dTMP kinase